MKNITECALDLYQAKELQRKYLHLQGQPYARDGEQFGIIECVAISPYDEINKWIFLQFYKDYKCPQKAIEYYHAPFYDLMLIVKSLKNEGEYTYQEVSTYQQTQLNANIAGQQPAM